MRGGIGRYGGENNLTVPFLFSPSPVTRARSSSAPDRLTFAPTRDCVTCLIRSHRHGSRFSALNQPSTHPSPPGPLAPNLRSIPLPSPHRTRAPLPITFRVPFSFITALLASFFLRAKPRLSVIKHRASRRGYSGVVLGSSHTVRRTHRLNVRKTTVARRRSAADTVIIINVVMTLIYIPVSVLFVSVVLHTHTHAQADAFRCTRTIFISIDSVCPVTRFSNDRYGLMSKLGSQHCE